MRTCFADPDVTCATSYSQGSIGAEILGSSALRQYKMDLYIASDFSIASDSMEKAENVFERSPDSSNALRVASSGSHDPGATVVEDPIDYDCSGLLRGGMFMLNNLPASVLLADISEAHLTALRDVILDIVSSKGGEANKEVVHALVDQRCEWIRQVPKMKQQSLVASVLGSNKSLFDISQKGVVRLVEPSAEGRRSR